MSVIHTNSIASLEALNNALCRYREQSLAIVQGFATELSNRVSRLENIGDRLWNMVQIAEENLRSCKIGRYYDPPEFRRSCYSQEVALDRAQNKYDRYQTIIQRLRQAQSQYGGAENQYHNALSNLSSSTVPKFTALIRSMKTYLEDDNMASSPYKNVPPPQEAIKVGRDAARNGDGNSPFSANKIAAAGIGAGVTGMVAAEFLRNYLQHNSDNPGGLIDDAFRRQTGGIGRNELLLMPPSPQRSALIGQYNAFCTEVEAEYSNELAKLREEEVVRREQQGRISIDEAETQYGYAKIADHVYNPKTALPKNLERITPNNISKDDPLYNLVKQIDEYNHENYITREARKVRFESDFHAELYKNKITGEYTLAFRGTDDLTDKVEDIKQAFGLSRQYAKAKNLGELINQSGLDKKNITIVGHSLGGGLATVASLQSKCHAYTYNQAEVSPLTIKFLGLKTDGHEKLITAYYDRKQWLMGVHDTVNRFVHHAASDRNMAALNKSDFNFSERMFEASKNPEKFQQDSPDNFFKRLGTVKTIDAKGEHGIAFVQDYFNTERKPVLYSSKFQSQMSMDGRVFNDLKIKKVI